MKETFEVGQRVVFRKAWVDGWEHMDDDLAYWCTLPYMVVKSTSPDGTSACLQRPLSGSWDGRAITAYIPPVVLPEDLFEI